MRAIVCTYIRDTPAAQAYFGFLTNNYQDIYRKPSKHSTKRSKTVHQL